MDQDCVIMMGEKGPQRQVFLQLPIKNTKPQKTVGLV